MANVKMLDNNALIKSNFFVKALRLNWLPEYSFAIFCKLKLNLFPIDACPFLYAGVSPLNHERAQKDHFGIYLRYQSEHQKSRILKGLFKNLICGLATKLEYINYNCYCDAKKWGKFCAHNVYLKKKKKNISADKTTDQANC